MCRILLLKTYSILQSSNKLETSLAIASIILETLNVVNDQIERRSYGESHLKDTIRSWEILIRKIRVVLLLCSRASYRVFEFNVDNFDKGLISIHKVLAEDTLCFTTKADQSAEHERRCYEVYQRKLDGGGLETHNNRSDILLAWGPIADRRWRDLMGIALSDDTIEKKNSSPAQSSNSPTNRTSGQHSHEKKHEVNNNKTLADKQNGAAVKRRRPLLLYFPNHYNPDYLGSHRAILCFER